MLTTAVVPSLARAILFYTVPLLLLRFSCVSLAEERERAGEQDDCVTSSERRMLGLSLEEKTSIPHLENEVWLHFIIWNVQHQYKPVIPMPPP